MIKAYQGHFEYDGRFVADDADVEIPAYMKVIINISDETIDPEINQFENDISNGLTIFKSKAGIIPPDIDKKALMKQKDGVSIFDLVTIFCGLFYYGALSAFIIAIPILILIAFFMTMLGY